MTDSDKQPEDHKTIDKSPASIDIAPEDQIEQPQSVADRIEEIPAPDGAVVMENLPTGQAADVAEILDPVTASKILAEMEPSLAASVIVDMPPPEASMVLGEMDPDDRVDVLAHLPEDFRKAVMGEMEPTDAAEVRQLEGYQRDTAGGIMTTQVTALSEYLTVEQAIIELREMNKQQEQMFYVYVVDRRKHLVGVLSMRDLILAKPDTLLQKIMIANVKSVPSTMDQEEVARLFRKYNYMAMPVVDDRNRLLGIITVDDVVDVIQEEATEDVQKMFGAGAEEKLSSPWHFSYRKRVLWLEVNLLTAFMAASVVAIFQSTIAALPILAAYQTIVSGMGGNAGAQAMAVTIRGIALGEVDRKALKKLFLKELMVGMASGVTIGLSTWAVAAYFNSEQNGVILGAVICVALIANHVNACLTGVSIPFIMKRLGFDPAQSATIFATTFTDCGGFFLTLGLAQLTLSWLTKTPLMHAATTQPI